MSSALHLNPPSLTKPTGYTHVVQAPVGRTIYISGQLALDQDGKIVGTGDFRAQTIRVFENIKAALEMAGADLGHLVKITTYLTDMSNAAVLREIRVGYLGAKPPAGTLIAVSSLIYKELLIEIDAIAVVPE